jgi:glycosyltransferase involved in cell wall biosynthesis
MFISIIVAVKNEEKYVRKCIDSLLNQSYPADKYETIVVDGFSADGTWEILQELKKRNPLLKIFRDPTNAAAGRNTGIRNAKGDYVAFIDGDAFADTNWLENISKTFGAVDAVGVGGPDLLPSDSTYKSKAIGMIMASPLASGGWLNPSVQHIMSSRAEYVKHIPTCNLCLKKDVVEKLGYFDEEFVSGEDLEFNTRLTLAGYKLYHSPLIRVAHYRKRHIRAFARQIYEWAKAKAAIIKKHGMTNPAYLSPVFGFVFLILLFSITLLSDKLSLFFLFLLLCVALYVLLIVFESIRIAHKNKDVRLFLYGLLLFPLIHISYSAGIFYGLLRRKIWCKKIT